MLPRVDLIALLTAVTKYLTKSLRGKSFPVACSRGDVVCDGGGGGEIVDLQEEARCGPALCVPGSPER